MDRNDLETEYGAQANESETLSEEQPRRRVGFFFDDEQQISASSTVLSKEPVSEEVAAESYLSAPTPPEKPLTVRIVKSGVLREMPLVRIARITRKRKQKTEDPPALLSE